MTKDGFQEYFECGRMVDGKYQERSHTRIHDDNNITLCLAEKRWVDLISGLDFPDKEYSEIIGKALRRRLEAARRNDGP